jgi:hypothetical protein
MTEIKNMGFNNIELDSKSWQDFFGRYEGGKSSQYVKMQEYMIAKANELDLGHNFLAIYSNGDNLYPNIRFSPPVLGEVVVKANGTEGRCYKYWSEKAQELMVSHIKGLFDILGTGYSVLIIDQQERLPVCTMWDPIIQPSFDEDGKERYINWLKSYYKYDINKLNKAYNNSFLGLTVIVQGRGILI